MECLNRCLYVLAVVQPIGDYFVVQRSRDEDHYGQGPGVVQLPSKCAKETEFNDLIAIQKVGIAFFLPAYQCVRRSPERSDGSLFLG